MWWVWWILIVVALLGGAVYALWQYSGGDRKYWPSRGIFFLEHSKVMSLYDRLTFKNPFHIIERLMYDELKRTGEPFAGVIEFRSPSLYVMDLDMIKHVMVKDFDYFVNRRQLFDFSKSDPLFHKMLINLKDQEWKDMRSSMSPTFTTGKIRRMFDVFGSSSHKMAEFIKNKVEKGETELEVRDIFTRYTLDVISSAAFGLDSQNFGETDSEFCKMAKRLQTVSIPRIFLLFAMLLFPKVFAYFGVSVSDKKSTTFFAEVTRKAIKHREATGEVRDDFLQLMIEAKNQQAREETEYDEVISEELAKSSNKVKLTEDLILSQSLLFFFAGFDTVETVLLFASYELAVHPEIQTKLYEEIRDASESNGGKLDHDLIMKIEYLDKVVSEVLRKYPPGVRTERITARPYKLPNSDVVVDKGVAVVAQVYGIHHDSEYYPDPEKFDPERFSAEAKATRNPYAYMPFGVGPRNCIAMRFALAEAKAAIAHLVLNFQLEPTAKTPIPMKYSKTSGFKPDGGKLFLSVKPR